MSLLFWKSPKTPELAGSFFFLSQFAVGDFSAIFSFFCRPLSFCPGVRRWHYLFLFVPVLPSLFLAWQWASRHLHAEEKHSQGPKCKRLFHLAAVQSQLSSSSYQQVVVHNNKDLVQLVNDWWKARIDAPDDPHHNQRRTDTFARTSNDFNVALTWLQCACVHTNSISILGFVPTPPPPPLLMLFSM